jgi:hypothetical protein
MNMRSMLIAVSGLLAACGRGRADREASKSPKMVAVSQPVAVANEATTSSTPKNACPRTGLWATCSVEQRLVRSGFVIVSVKEDPVRRPGFSVPAAVYHLGHSRLEVFLYQSPAAASADVARLDTLTSSPRGAKRTYVTAPTFIRSANLLAVLLTDSPVQADRLSLALTAGAPQP